MFGLGKNIARVSYEEVEEIIPLPNLLSETQWDKYIFEILIYNQELYKVKDTLVQYWNGNHYIRQFYIKDAKILS